MTRFLISVFTLTMFLMVGYLLWNSIRKYLGIRRLQRAIKRLELRYEEFFSQQRLKWELENPIGQPDLSFWRESALRQLTPELDALWGQLSSLPFADLPTALSSSLFPQAIAAFREGSEMSSSSPTFHSESKQAFRHAFTEALEADMDRKWLLLQTGSSL